MYPSGKFVLRLDPKLHVSLRTASKKLGLSLNGFCERQLKLALGLAQHSEQATQFGIPFGKLQSALQDAGLDVRGCIVFGSMARGEALPSSDIDLLFVLPPGTSPEREHYRRWDRNVASLLKETTFREVSPQFVEMTSSVQEAGGLWYQIALEGIILWDDDRAISRTLLRIRESIARGELIRYISHGHPYWIRKRQ